MSQSFGPVLVIRLNWFGRIKALVFGIVSVPLGVAFDDVADMPLSDWDTDGD